MEKNEIKSISCNNVLAPFLRNQYFYGKLLTVRDFENEQSYFIKKQRLINKHIHGEGVVCGLTVEKVDENIIRIRSGIALDCCGREIVVPEDVEKKIPIENGVNKYWVTLQYDECGEEEIASATEANSCTEECCFSRIKEKYKIEILKEEPETCNSVHVDNLCKLWGSLDFDKKEESELHPNPNPVDLRFSVDTNDWTIAGLEKAHRVNNMPEKFVKQYQGTCSSTDNENRPLVLAIVTLSLSKEKKLTINKIDNALVTATGFDKKLVHTNPKLFELLKCGGREEGDFAKINDIDWEHNKTYQVKMINEGIVESGTENTLMISGDFPPQDDIKPGMQLYLKKDIEETSDYQVGITKNYNEQNRTITIEENWSSKPVNGDKYYIINDETDKFVARLIDHKVTFDHSMDKITVNTKTLTLSLNNFMVVLDALDGEDIEIPRNTLQIPIYKKWNNEDTILQFGIPEELMPDNFSHAMGSYLQKKQVLSFMRKENLGTGIVYPIKWLTGTRVHIQIKGDFVFSQNEKVLDANHIKGTMPTGNGSAGGLFESWYDLEYDSSALSIIQAYLSQEAKKFTKGFVIDDIKDNIVGMEKSTPLMLNMMVKNNLLYKENGKYFPLPDPDKTIIAVDTKHVYLNTSALNLSESLKKRGVSVTLKSVKDLTNEDKNNHDVILLRGSDLASDTSTKFKDVSSKVEWNKSNGDIEIAHELSNVSRPPVFMIGGRNKAAVENAVNTYISRYSDPQ